MICAPRVVLVGCEKRSLDEWLEKYEEIGRTYRYTDEEIEEYGRYLRLVKEMENYPSVRGCVVE